MSSANRDTHERKLMYPEGIARAYKLKAGYLQLIHWICELNREEARLEFFADDRWWCCISVEEMNFYGMNGYSRRAIRMFVDECIESGVLTKRDELPGVRSRSNIYAIDYARICEVVHGFAPQAVDVLCGLDEFQDHKDAPTFAESYRSWRRAFFDRGSDEQLFRKNREVILSGDSVCAYCGGEADSVDHIKPRSKGGTSELSNLAACCMPCNQSKSTNLVSEWSAGDE